MSIGNLKDQGNKGNNFPYQLRTLQLLSDISSGISALPGVDHESRTSTYQAINAGVGYAIGDIIVRYDIIDLATGLLESTLWFNQTTQIQITPAPLPGDLTPISAPSSVSVSNGPGASAVNIQDGGNAITVDDGGGSITVDGTVALDAASLTALENITVQNGAGAAAVNIQDGGNSVTVDDGGVALATYPFPTTMVSGATGAITNTSATTIIAAQAGAVTYVTQILVTNAHATVGTVVRIIDGATTNVLYTGYAAPAGGGFSISFPTPLRMPSSNSALQIICVTTGSEVYASACGFAK